MQFLQWNDGGKRTSLLHWRTEKLSYRRAMEILILITVNVANILSVWLAAKNNRLTWGIGFVGVAITAVMFFMSGHYMSFAFNTYSAIMCVIGQFRWNSSVQKNDEAIRWMNPYLLIVISLLLAFLIYAIFNLSPVLTNGKLSLNVIDALYLLPSLSTI